MNRPARAIWGLVVVAGTTVVGVATQEPAFVVITFLGGLWLPRILGLRGRGWAGGCSAMQGRRRHVEERLEAWHRGAHGESQPPATSVAQV
jgi:hypothetical protein